MNGKEKTQAASEYAEIGVKIATESSYVHLKHEQIAKAAKVATSSVYYALGTTSDMRAAVVRKAVEMGNVTVVAQALGLRHPDAVNAPQLLKARAVKLLGTL